MTHARRLILAFLAAASLAGGAARAAEVYSERHGRGPERPGDVGARQRRPRARRPRSSSRRRTSSSSTATSPAGAARPRPLRGRSRNRCGRRPGRAGRTPGAPRLRYHRGAPAHPAAPRPSGGAARGERVCGVVRRPRRAADVQVGRHARARPGGAAGELRAADAAGREDDHFEVRLTARPRLLRTLKLGKGGGCWPRAGRRSRTAGGTSCCAPSRPPRPRLRPRRHPPARPRRRCRPPCRPRSDWRSSRWPTSARRARRPTRRRAAQGVHDRQHRPSPTSG